MMLSGRILTVIAGVTLVVKLGLLLVLVPRHGIAGAAIATAIAMVIAMQGQAFAGAHHLKQRVYSARILPVLGATAVCGAAGRALFVGLEARLGELAATALAGAAAFVGLAGVLLLILDADERTGLRRLLRLAPRAA
jgi:O-antigen/teichoic acid export membrane protein